MPMKGFKNQGLEGRNGAIWKRHVLRGETQTALAEEYGLDVSTVCRIIKDVRENMPEYVRSEMLQDSIERNADLRRRLMELAEMPGAPVTAGKDGDVVRDPENDDAVVRDYGLRLAAAKQLAALDDQLAKRMGLDSAQKIESTTSVRYEIAGLNEDDLS